MPITIFERIAQMRAHLDNRNAHIEQWNRDNENVTGAPRPHDENGTKICRELPAFLDAVEQFARENNSASESDLQAENARLKERLALYDIQVNEPPANMTERVEELQSLLDEHASVCAISNDKTLIYKAKRTADVSRRLIERLLIFLPDVRFLLRVNVLLTERVRELEPFEPKLLGFENGEVRVATARAMMQKMVESFEALNGYGEFNYTETEFLPSIGNGYSFFVTVRRGDKPTPHQLKKQVEERLKALFEFKDPAVELPVVDVEMRCSVPVEVKTRQGSELSQWYTKWGLEQNETGWCYAHTDELIVNSGPILGWRHLFPESLDALVN